MKSKLALAVAFVTLIQSPLTSALRLGEIVIESKVNEPFKASIELGSTKGITAKQILVQMASAEVFRNANIEKPYHLNDIAFKVVNGRNGKVLHLSSSQKISEPYLNFILDTRWPNGRVMREYLALLDLPVHSSAKGTAINTVQATQVPTAVEPSNQRSDVRAQVAGTFNGATNSPRNSQSFSGNQNNSASKNRPNSYRVQASDTLWEIAQQYKIKNASVEQTMHVLQKSNPDAFINGNINQLKKGAILRMPENDGENVIAQTEALAWHREQYSAWKKTKSLSGDLKQALDGSKSSKQQLAEAPIKDGRLTLTSGLETKSHDARAEKSLGSSASDAHGSSSDDTIKALEQQDRKKLEYSSLEKRYDTLQERFGQLEKLISLKNAQLAELTASIDKSDEILEALNQEDGSQPVASSNNRVGTPEANSDVSSVVSNEETNPLGTDDETTSELAAAALAVKAAGVNGSPLGPDGSTPPETPPPESTPPESSPPNGASANSLASPEGLFQQVLAFLPPIVSKNLQWVAGGLVGLFLALLAFLRFRSSSDGEGEVDTEFLEQAENVLVNAEEVAFSSQALAPQQWSTDVDESEKEDSSSETNKDISDELAEVDIFLNFGRHEQAIIVLNKLVANDEQNVDVNLKLIEVQQASGDTEAAKAAAATLLAFAPEQQPQVDSLLGDAAKAEVSSPAQDVDLSVGDQSNADLPAVDLDSTSVEENLDLPSLDMDLDEGGLVFDDSAASADESLLSTSGSAIDTEATIPEFDATLDLDGLGDDLDPALETTIDSGETGDLAGATSYGDSVENVSDLEFAEAFVEPADDQIMPSLEESGEVPDGLTLDEGSLEIDLETVSDDLDEIDLAAATAELEASPVQKIDQDLAEAYGDFGEEIFDDSGVASESAVALEPEVASNVDSGASDGNLNVSLDLDSDSNEDLSAVEFDLDSGLESGNETLDLLEPEASTDTAAEVASKEAISDADLETEYQTATEMLDQIDEEEVVESNTIEMVENGTVEATEAVNEEASGAIDDEVATKLDLARAYLEMGDMDGAKGVLDEVIEEGSSQQKQEASSILQKIA